MLRCLAIFGRPSDSEAIRIDSEGQSVCVFANPVMEKVIEIDQPAEMQDESAGDDQEPLTDLTALDEKPLDTQTQDNPSPDEKIIDEPSLDNDLEDPDA